MTLRTTMSLILQACTIGLCATEGYAAEDAPVVIWASSPVRPGETVLVHGGHFGGDSRVELTKGDRKATVTPVSVSETTLMFVYPEGWEAGIVGCAVVSGGMRSKPFEINAPAVWWIHGDRGREASTASGGLRLFGNCLSDPDGPKPKVSLRPVGGGVAVSLQVADVNAFSIETDGWEQLGAGEYEVTLVRSPACPPVVAGTITVSERPCMVPDRVFDVTDFGAVADNGIDDTAAILAALEALKANGGGVLFFPRGRFQANATIELPPNSAMRGVGNDQSMLDWPDRFEPLPALIQGTHSFEISDMFLTCGNHKDGIVANLPEHRYRLPAEEQADYECGNILIRNVTLRMLYSQFVNNDIDELKRRLPPIHYARALRMGGENVTVVDNDIYCAAGGVFELRASWSNVSNNTLSRGNIIGWNGFAGRQLIVANNHFGGANCTSFYGMPDGSENVYWGNNYHENNFDGNNRETITGDGRYHVYLDTVERITPTSMKLCGEVDWIRGGVAAWQDGAVQIAAGRGVGQFRRIKAIHGATVELESPWDIVPDEKSVINIGSFRRRFIYTENKAYDSTIALQFYGTMIEGIVANNETSRTGGYNGDAMSGEANWFNQFINNTIVSGNSYRGPRNEEPATDAQLGLLAYGSGRGSHRYTLVRSCVVRDNHLRCGAKLNVQGWVVDSLLENNSVANVRTGVTVSREARNIVLRGNTFRGVRNPYAYDSQSVVIRPAEELRTAMDAASAILGWDDASDAMPAEWKDVRRKTELLDAAPAEIATAWETVAAAFARSQAGKTVSADLVRTLLGLWIEAPNWGTAAETIREGKAGRSPLLVRAAGSRVAGTLTLSVPLADFPVDGWSFELPKLAVAPGKEAGNNAAITKPAGSARLLRIPVHCELAGNGWNLGFETELFDRWDCIPFEKSRVSRPFENPLGAGKRLGYIPYDRLPKPSDAVPGGVAVDRDRLLFEPLFADSATEGQVVYATTSFRAASSTLARFEFDRDCLLFVNGQVIGTTLPRGQWGCIRLQEGENRIELLIQPQKRADWKVRVPRVTWIEKPLAALDAEF